MRLSLRRTGQESKIYLMIPMSMTMTLEPDPQRNRGPSGQGYTGLPIIIESEIIEANHEQPELNLSERNLFQKQRNNQVQPSFGLGNEN